MLWQLTLGCEHCFCRVRGKLAIRRFAAVGSVTVCGILELEEPVDANDLEDALFALASARKDFQAGAGAITIGFSCYVHGGKWTRETSGIAFDSYQGLANHGNPEIVCYDFVLQTSIRFGINPCGDAHACALAKGWVHKMQFLFDCYTEAADRKAFRFTELVLARYEEPAGLREIDVTGSAQAQARLRQLCVLKPRKQAVNA